jgi:uncharacterized protein YoxC
MALDPIFWLGLSILLVAVSLTAVLMATLPAMRELARAARSAEKLFDTLSRELPPTLDSIRRTSQEINQLKGDVSEGVQNTSQIVQHVDEGISTAKQQVRQAKTVTRSVWAGVRAAWGVFQQERDSESREPELEKEWQAEEDLLEADDELGGAIVPESIASELLETDSEMADLGSAMK